MSAFKDMVARDNLNVFLNTDEFADLRTIVYDGVEYKDIPVVINGNVEKDRSQGTSDHMQGLYLVSKILHCAKEHLGGNQPEKGSRIWVSDEDGYLNDYYVAQSDSESGMLRIELEAVSE